MTGAEPVQDRKARIIAAVFGVNLVVGAVLVSMYPELADPNRMPAAMQAVQGGALNLVYQVVVLLLCFAWLGIDSRQLGIRRPWWLNVGIVLLTSIFVPYYLYKTRPANHRGAAILGYFGIVFGSMIAMMVGMFMALMIGGTPAAAPGTGV